jgi:hypothetical protein
VRLDGGTGGSAEYPIERLGRAVHVTRIAEGTSDVRRIVIARDDLDAGEGRDRPTRAAVESTIEHTGALRDRGGPRGVRTHAGSALSRHARAGR